MPCNSKTQYFLINQKNLLDCLGCKLLPLVNPYQCKEKWCDT